MAKRIVVKIVSVVGITIGLLIPLIMIRGLVLERTEFRREARENIAQSWTGAQTVVGPVLIVPHSRLESRVDEDDPEKEEKTLVRRQKILLPEVLQVSSIVKTELRRRGLYHIPVYLTDLTIRGSFDATPMLKELDRFPDSVLEESLVSLGITDNRGIATPPTLRWNSEPFEFRSGSLLPGIRNGVRSDVGIVNPEHSYTFEMTLELRGMESLSFLPMGRDTHVTMDAEWPHPSFTGRFLPVEYEIADGAFQAEWSLSHLATNPEEIIESLVDHGEPMLAGDSFGVSLITPVDIYQQAERSVKYGNLFVVLTFTGFFVVEFARRLNFHAMQYLLVGLALVIFFLLLLSLSEHIGFGWAYLVASVGCVGLVGVYLSASVGRFSSGVSIVGVLSGLYGMLYAILRSEDNALLMGSLLLFAALAAVMLVTRKLDWNKLGGQLVPPPQPPQPPLGTPASGAPGD
jgi:inner membrane protein